MEAAVAAVAAGIVTKAGVPPWPTPPSERMPLLAATQRAPAQTAALPPPPPLLLALGTADPEAGAATACRTTARVVELP
jgi:hypothetical protein